MKIVKHENIRLVARNIQSFEAIKYIASSDHSEVHKLVIRMISGHTYSFKFKSQKELLSFIDSNDL